MRGVAAEALTLMFRRVGPVSPRLPVPLALTIALHQPIRIFLPIAGSGPRPKLQFHRPLRGHPRQIQSCSAADPHRVSSQPAPAGSSCRRSSVCSPVQVRHEQPKTVLPHTGDRLHPVTPLAGTQSKTTYGCSDGRCQGAPNARKKGLDISLVPCCLLVGRQGFEPWTNGLRVRERPSEYVIYQQLTGAPVATIAPQCTTVQD